MFYIGSDTIFSKKHTVPWRHSFRTNWYGDRIYRKRSPLISLRWFPSHSLGVQQRVAPRGEVESGPYFDWFPAKPVLRGCAGCVRSSYHPHPPSPIWPETPYFSGHFGFWLTKIRVCLTHKAPSKTSISRKHAWHVIVSTISYIGYMLGKYLNVS